MNGAEPKWSSERDGGMLASFLQGCFGDVEIDVEPVSAEIS